MTAFLSSARGHGHPREAARSRRWRQDGSPKTRFLHPPVHLERVPALGRGYKKTPNTSTPSRCREPSETPAGFSRSLFLSRLSPFLGTTGAASFPSAAPTSPWTPRPPEPIPAFYSLAAKVEALRPAPEGVLPPGAASQRRRPGLHPSRYRRVYGRRGARQPPPHALLAPPARVDEDSVLLLLLLHSQLAVAFLRKAACLQGCSAHTCLQKFCLR